jgi:hypothetical protein
LIQEFNGNEFSSGVLVLRGHVHEDFLTIISNVKLTPVKKWWQRVSTGDR